jgi:ankyrin repeat protein
MLEADLNLKTININWQNFESKCTPLLIASANGHDKIVEILIQNGADVAIRDEREATALHHAAQSGHSSIVEMLIKAGCDLDALDKNRWTPVMNACYWANESALLVLLKAGADSNLKNIDGRTALHEVCRSPSTQETVLASIAKRLIQAGSDVNLSSSSVHKEDLNALMYAAYHNHVGVANILIEYNCNLDRTDHQGWNALHWAADRDHIEIVKLNSKGNRAELALDRAKSDSVRDIISKHSMNSDCYINSQSNHVKNHVNLVNHVSMIETSPINATA